MKSMTCDKIRSSGLPLFCGKIVAKSVFSISYGMRYAEVLNGYYVHRTAESVRPDSNRETRMPCGRMTYIAVLLADCSLNHANTFANTGNDRFGQGAGKVLR